jgi:glutamyl-tRNA reductase
MSLLAVGLNHTTAPVDVRERLAVPREQIGESLSGLRQQAELSEVVLLSTCNRVEVYAVQPDAAAPDRIVDALAQLRGMSGELVRRHCFVRERQTVGPILDRCLTMAFRGAKRVRSETDVARGGASVASVAVELARSIFGQLRGSTVALIGAGEMGRQAALHLRADGAEQVLVVNRSRERGEELALSIGGRYLGWDQLDEALISADVVITSTGANAQVMPAANQPITHVIEPRMMRRIMRRRRGAPIFMVDIAVPRDVDPKVGRLDSVYVYDVDDLQKILGQNLQARGHEAEAAGAVLEQEIAAFLHWQRARALNPVIRDLRSHAHSIMQHELDKALVRLGQLGQLDEAQREVVAALGHAITQKILHRPLKALRESAIHAEGDDLSGALRTLFALEQALDEQDLAIKFDGETDGEVDELDEPVEL